jgi:hypothetical protein
MTTAPCEQVSFALRQILCAVTCGGQPEEAAKNAPKLTCRLMRMQSNIRSVLLQWLDKL